MQWNRCRDKNMYSKLTLGDDLNIVSIVYVNGKHLESIEATSRCKTRDQTFKLVQTRRNSIVLEWEFERPQQNDAGQTFWLWDKTGVWGIHQKILFDVNVQRTYETWTQKEFCVFTDVWHDESCFPTFRLLWPYFLCSCSPSFRPSGEPS